MSERKVLNKYYPPDFDPSRLPRVKRAKNRQFTIRLMAPCNMRCKACGEYIYKGKKFNARKEDVIGDTYLGIQIYRFYIKCTKCLHEITFKTDPSNGDYELEHSAIRNFESIRLAEKQAKDDQKQKAEEEATNPMKLLENRTRDSRQEMATIEALEDIKELNARQSSIDPLQMLLAQQEQAKQLAIRRKQMEEEDDLEEIRRAFRKNVVKYEEYEDDKEVNDDKSEITVDLVEEEKPIVSSNNDSDQKRKMPIVFAQPNPSITKQKQLLNMLVRKKIKTDENPKSQSKPTSLSLLAAYADDDSSDND
ncbi:unnamed protein product [Didymodactylos carnosus]|uniref:Splicing factor YJU2 n=1 Tax=Didymodactylos carnosus TaxID=1234261 RepID=A0A814A1T0_9BILA|nr:unnamed protein product [Didymodactylos carnosus]CAF0907722.1 unnamed protein product [Didymodactylos carnosus]CAF1042713.1 unnamed protein product [Didymodactylos carnosus]CAF3689179.1 unnamed protein product [Didymodactylos carnosus]CAF3689207.1 unnamed protein product [Didymodactylos carnosus]